MELQDWTCPLGRQLSLYHRGRHWFWLFFSYRVLLKKSGCKIPRIELEEMGPSLDLVMRRTHLASDDLYKLSLKQPKALKVCTMENILLPDLYVKKSKSWSINYPIFDQSLLLYRLTNISGAVALLWWISGVQIPLWLQTRVEQIFISKLQIVYVALLLPLDLVV